MRRLPPAMVAMLLLPACQALNSETGELCIARPESHGFTNIVPVEVTVDGIKMISGSGGDARCTDLPVGDHEVELAWYWDPRDPAPEHIVSETVSVTIPKGGTASLDICFRKGPRYPDWNFGPAGTCPVPF